MDVDALWENFGVRTAAIEFGKVAKKGDEEAKAKFEFLLFQIEKASGRPAEVKKKPESVAPAPEETGDAEPAVITEGVEPPAHIQAILSKNPNMLTAEEVQLVQQWDREHIKPLVVDKEAPRRRWEEQTKLLASLCADKRGEFVIDVPADFDVNNIVGMLLDAGLPFEQVEGAQPFAKPVDLSAAPGFNMEKALKSGREDRWLVRMRRK